MDDLISRQAVKEIAYKQIRKQNEGFLLKEQRDILFNLADRIIDALPSVQPKTTRKVIASSRDGITMWYKCEKCGEAVDQSDNYCSCCGRRFSDE